MQAKKYFFYTTSKLKALAPYFNNIHFLFIFILNFLQSFMNFLICAFCQKEIKVHLAEAAQNIKSSIQRNDLPAFQTVLADPIVQYYINTPFIKSDYGKFTILHWLVATQSSNQTHKETIPKAVYTKKIVFFEKMANNFYHQEYAKKEKVEALKNTIMQDFKPITDRLKAMNPGKQKEKAVRAFQIAIDKAIGVVEQSQKESFALKTAIESIKTIQETINDIKDLIKKINAFTDHVESNPNFHTNVIDSLRHIHIQFKILDNELANISETDPYLCKGNESSHPSIVKFILFYKNSLAFELPALLASLKAVLSSKTKRHNKLQKTDPTLIQELSTIPHIIACRINPFKCRQAMIDTYFEAGGNFNVTDFQGNTAFLCSLQQKSTLLFAHYFLNSSDPHIKKHLDANQANYSKVTALMLAAAAGEVDLIDKLTKLGANPLAKDNQGDSAWCYAARRLELEAIKKLNETANIFWQIEQKNSLSTMQQLSVFLRFTTSLHSIHKEENILFAAISEKENIAISHREDTNDYKDIRTRRVEIFKFLLNRGFNPNASTSEGETVLIRCLAQSLTDCAVVLLQYKALLVPKTQALDYLQKHTKVLDYFKKISLEELGKKIFLNYIKTIYRYCNLEAKPFNIDKLDDWFLPFGKDLLKDYRPLLENKAHLANLFRPEIIATKKPAQSFSFSKVPTPKKKAQLNPVENNWPQTKLYLQRMTHKFLDLLEEKPSTWEESLAHPNSKLPNNKKFLLEFLATILENGPEFALVNAAKDKNYGRDIIYSILYMYIITVEDSCLLEAKFNMKPSTISYKSVLKAAEIALQENNQKVLSMLQDFLLKKDKLLFSGTFPSTIKKSSSPRTIRQLFLHQEVPPGSAASLDNAIRPQGDCTGSLASFEGTQTDAALSQDSPHNSSASAEECLIFSKLTVQLPRSASKNSFNLQSPPVRPKQNCLPNDNHWLTPHTDNDFQYNNCSFQQVESIRQWTVKIVLPRNSSQETQTFIVPSSVTDDNPKSAQILPKIEARYLSFMRPTLLRQSSDPILNIARLPHSQTKDSCRNSCPKP